MARNCSWRVRKQPAREGRTILCLVTMDCSQSSICRALFNTYGASLTEECDGIDVIENGCDDWGE